MTKAIIYNSILIAAATFTFWYALYPQGLNYHEEYQFFVGSWSYLAEKLTLPGGFADWIAEFLVQFFALPVLGALVMMLISVLLYVFSSSCLIPILVILAMGDCNLMPTYGVSLAIVLALCKPISKSKGFKIILTPVLWWFAGPLGLIAAIYSIVVNKSKYDIIALLTTIAAIVTARYTILVQQPTEAICYGIFYHRYFPKPEILPAIIPLVALGGIVLSDVFKKHDFKPYVKVSFCILVIGLGYLSHSRFYDKDMWSQLAQDLNVRNKNWTKVIAEAEKHQARTPFSASCVNLALIMNGEADRMMKFYQFGGDGLLVPAVRDNLTNMATAEAFWRLGFINSCFKLCFDMQEAGGQYKKSVRHTKRMAECCIVNGWYQVAEKYINMLEKTAMYRSWAKEARTYLHNEDKISENPVYNYLRAARPDKSIIFNEIEMDKMLALAYHQNNSNLLAALYYKAYTDIAKGSQANISTGESGQNNLLQ